MNETIHYKTKKETEIDKLLDKRTETLNELNKLKGEIDNMLLNNSDSENRTDQQLNNNATIEQYKRFTILKQIDIDAIDKKINEIRGIES